MIKIYPFGTIKIMTNNTTTVIVSPSGNFYGSEQVLYDFLLATTQSYIVFVPEKSIFSQKLEKANLHQKHQLRFFSTSKLYLLYIKICYALFKMTKGA